MMISRGQFTDWFGLSRPVQRAFTGMLAVAAIAISACGGSGSPSNFQASATSPASSTTLQSIAPTGAFGAGTPLASNDIDSRAASLSAAVNASPLIAAGTSLERWRAYDFSFTSSAAIANPGTVNLSATFTGPGNAKLTIPAFYTSNNTWIVRFSPTVTGSWSYATSSTVSSLTAKTGTFNSVANTNPLVRGLRQIDPANKRHFIWEDGSRNYLLGYELDYLASLSLGDPTIANTKKLVDMVAANGFTEILMAAYAELTTWAPGSVSTGSNPTAKFANDYGPPSVYPFEQKAGGRFDYTKPIQAYWDNLDKVVEYIHEKGLSTHFYLRMQYNKYENTDLHRIPNSGTADEVAYLKYIVSRYQAYPSIIFSYEKEMTSKPASEITSSINLISSFDAYKRLKTAHDAQKVNYDPVQNVAVDFITDQMRPATYAQALLIRQYKDAPFYDAEISYQSRLNPLTNQLENTYDGGTNSAESVFDKVMEVAMTGGYIAYYYSHHAWDVMEFNEVPRNIAYYSNLSKFMTSTNWFKMNPKDQLLGSGAQGKHCLADEGSSYIVYLARNQTSATLQVNGVAAGATLSGKWVNMLTGASVAVANVGNGTVALTKPTGWTEPAMLSLQTNAAAGGNKPPNVNAGADQTSSLLSVQVSGTVSDDGLPAGAALSQNWTLDSGPALATVSFANPTALSTTATFSAPGTYVLRLTGRDTLLSAFDVLTVTVGAANKAPVISAGSDVQLPLIGEVNLGGSATDDGLPLGGAYNEAWTMLSGPAPVVFNTPNRANGGTVRFSQAGVYVLRLTVSDGALTSTDDVTYTVAAAPPIGGTGLTGSYFNNVNLTAPAVFTRNDPGVNFTWGTGSPDARIAADNFSVRWTGFVKAPVTGTYTFYVSSNDGNRLTIGTTAITNTWTSGVKDVNGTIALTAGQSYPITLDFFEAVGSATVSLSWSHPSQPTRVVIPATQLSP